MINKIFKQFIHLKIVVWKCWKFKSKFNIKLLNSLNKAHLMFCVLSLVHTGNYYWMYTEEWASLLSRADIMKLSCFETTFLALRATPRLLEEQLLHRFPFRTMEFGPQPRGGENRLIRWGISCLLPSMLTSYFLQSSVGCHFKWEVIKDSNPCISQN